MRLLSKIFLLILLSLSCQAAVEFDGVDDYIVAPSSINSSLNPTNITVSAWVYPHTLNAYRGVINEAYTGDGQVRFLLGTYNTNRFSAGYYNGSWRLAEAAGTLNQWSHIAGSFNGSILKLYIDGAEVDNTATTALMGGNEAWRIGRRWDHNDYFDGLIDDGRIYNRTLSATEIEVLYNSRSKRPSGSLANGLVAHYEMDDKEIGHLVSQAQDDSGNLNHGELVGFDNLVSNGFSNDVPAQIGTGTSLEFDGVDDYAIINNSVDSSQQGAVSLWFKSTDTAANANFVSTADEGTNNHYWLLRLDTGAIELLTHDGTTAEGIKTNSSGFNDGNWHNVTFVSDGSSYTCYVDGSSETMTGNNTGKWLGDISLRDNLTFGNRVQNTILNYYEGYIDKVHIYNKALNSAEISYLYNGSGMNPGTSNLQALWAFNDSALKDSSGNDNHGVGIGGDSLKYTEGVLRR